MSYDKARSISLNRKANKIMVSVASSNVIPKTYYNCEYAKNTDKSFEWKLGQLLRDISGGNIHLNMSLYKWNYAIHKANNKLGYGNFYSGLEDNNNKSLYEETSHKHTIYYIGKKPYSYNNDERFIEITQEQADNGDYILDYEYNGNKQYYREVELQADNERIERILDEYSSVFMKYFNEEHKGQYYLLSENRGIIKPIGTQGKYYYYYTNIPSKDKLMDYYKAYTLSINCSRENDKVEIVKYEE